MVRYPDIFQLVSQSGSFVNGEYVPGASSDPVEFVGRLELTTDSLGSQYTKIDRNAKLFCEKIEAKEGDTIVWLSDGQDEHRVFSVLESPKRQTYSELWLK